MIKKYILIFWTVLIAGSSFSQSLTLNGFKSVSKNGISPILHNKEVKGYTLFYEGDKADRKNSNYVIDIYDQDLKKVKGIDLVKPKDDYMLVSNVYNDEALAFLFYDFKKKTFDIESYSNDLTKLGEINTLEVTKADNRTMVQNQALSSSGGQSAYSTSISLYPIPKKGFVKNSINGYSKGWVLEMYDNKLNKKWSLESGDTKDYQNIIPVDATEKYLLLSMLQRKSLLSQKFESFLILIDVETGKKLFEISPESDPTEQLSVTGISLDEATNEIITVGDYYMTSEKPGFAAGTGFYIKKFSIEGKEINKKFYAWNKEVMKVAGNQYIDQSFVNFTHQIQKMADGKTYIVVEQYKRKFNAGGAAMMALGGSASVLKGVIGNILIFSLNNSDLSLSGVKQIEKEESTVTLIPGSEIYGPGITGMLMKMFGDFDYQFIVNSANDKTFNAVYVSYAKEKGEAEKKIIGNILLGDDGKITEDKIEVAGKVTTSYIYPAKPGYILTVDFLKKLKQLDLKLIKVNSK